MFYVITSIPILRTSILQCVKSLYRRRPTHQREQTFDVASPCALVVLLLLLYLRTGLSVTVR
jgi:hypothetical protein